ncbi:MAG: MipA/OmpV family protein [Pseudomonadota bacterium]
MSVVKYAAIAGALLASVRLSAAEPAWPDALDIDFNYRNSALSGDTRRWDIRLGLGVEQEPTFQGSDKSETEADIFLVAAYRGDFGNVFFTGEGLGYSRLVTPSFGIQLNLEAEDTREVEDDSRLEGLGNQDEETELEIIGRYFAGPWQFGGSVALATGDKGVVWFVGGGYTARLANDRLFVNISADVSGSDETNQQTDFGITAEQAANSTFGYPEYSPGGGLKSYGLGMNADYQLTDRWFLYGELDYERLLGDVADSPLVAMGGSETNIEAGIGFYYRF